MTISKIVDKILIGKRNDYITHEETSFHLQETVGEQRAGPV